MFILPLLPLLYVGLAVFLSWWVMRWVGRRNGPEKRFKRWSAGVATFVVMILLPTWNIIAARVYMKYRCSQEGGATIYRTISLPHSYFNRYGLPDAERREDKRFPGGLLCFGDDCYACSSRRTMELSLQPKSEISRLEMRCIDPVSGELLGKSVSFSHATWYVEGSSAAICPPTAKGRALFRKIFVPEGQGR